MSSVGLHYWARENMVTDEPLQVRYSAKYGGSLAGRRLEGKAYEYHRYATKVYRYVGMDERTAKACAAAKLKQYTKPRFFWYWEGDVGGSLNFYREEKAGATVKAKHAGGHLWSVEISVNEDDVYYSPLWIDDIAAAGVFAGGDYDEDDAPGAVLIVNSVYWLSASPHNQLWLGYSHIIDDWAADELKAQYTVNGKTWIDYTPPLAPSNYNDGVWCMGSGDALPANAYKWRLVYGDVYSNAVAAPGSSAAMTNTITLGAPEYRYGYWRIPYTQDVLGFAASGATLEQSADGAEWTAAQSYMVGAAEVNTGDGAETSAAARWWRLRFGGVASNAVSVAATATEEETGDE